ncbi:unnamed protein product [Closterium sp. Naga37s-1]|nr:unnamed protein product [Closterium sp. Naga37s-1]
MSVSPRPAFPLADGISLANASRHWASFPTASVGVASVILPSIALPAAIVAQVSENLCFIFPQVPAVDPPSAPRSPVFLHASAPCRPAAPFLAGVPWASASLHLAAPPAVVGLLAFAGAQLLFLRVIPASATRRVLLLLGSNWDVMVPARLFVDVLLLVSLVPRFVAMRLLPRPVGP